MRSPTDRFSAACRLDHYTGPYSIRVLVPYSCHIDRFRQRAAIGLVEAPHSMPIMELDGFESCVRASCRGDAF